MKNLLLLYMAFWAISAAGQNVDTRVFEMRIYYAAPGKIDDLTARFRNHTTQLFKKHGMENIGYWKPISNDKNQLIYILAYPNMAAREAAWNAFSVDPKWKKVQAKSEKNGPIVEKVESVFMSATDFSPKITASKRGGRVFELRTYTTLAGKSADLQARFRNHTQKLFVKHGMTNIAYWVTIEKEGVEPKIIYILAHPSEAAGKKNFDNFRKDPEWIKVKEDSEKQGKILEKFESVYMNALDFSKIK